MVFLRAMPELNLDALVPLSARLDEFARDLEMTGAAKDAASVRSALGEYRSRMAASDPIGALVAVTAIGPMALGAIRG